MALKVGELYALFTIDHSAVDSAIDSIEGKLNKMSTTFTRAGTLWTNALTRPILDFGKDSVNTAMDYGKEMSNAMAKFGFDTTTEAGTEAYAEAYAALDAEVMRVAKDSVYTTAEAAGAIDKMAMAGWSWEASVAALEPMLDLAAASGEDLVTVSDIVTDAMTAFGLTFESAGYDIDTFNGMVAHFSNILSTAATSSNTNIGMLGESFKYVGSMAGAMGYSVDDVAQVLGLMANRGVKASQAGTSLRRLFSNLIDPKGDAADTVAELGLSLMDTEGNMLSLMDVMKQLREAFGNIELTNDDYIKQLSNLFQDNVEVIQAYEEYEAKLAQLEEQGDTSGIAQLNTDNQGIISQYKQYEAAVDELYKSLLNSAEGADYLKIKNANALGGARGMLALLAITQSTEQEFNDLLSSLEEADSYGNGEGRTHVMKEMQLDNAQGSLDKFLSSVNVLKTEVGDLINESLVPMIDKAKEIVDNFIEMDDEQKKAIMDVIGLAAAIGPALTGVGLLTKLLPSLGSALSFVTSPLGLITSMLAMVAISALDAEGTISKGLSGIGEALGIDTSGLEDIDINEMIDSMFSGLDDLANSPVITGFMTRFGEGLSGAVSSIKSLEVSALLHQLIGGITSITDDGGVISNFMSMLGNAFQDGMSALGNLTGQLLAYIFSVQGLTDFKNAGVALGKLLVKGVVSGVTGVGNFVKETIETVLVGWGVLSQEELDAAKQAGEELATATAEAYQDAASGKLELTGGEELFINWANFFGGQNLQDLDTASTDLVHQIDGALGAAAKESDSGETFRDNLLSNLFWNNDSWIDAADKKGFDLSDNTLDISKLLPEIGVNIEDILPKFEDVDFWGNLLTAVQSGDRAEVMTVINSMIQEMAAALSEGTEEAAESTPEIDLDVKTFAEETGLDLENAESTIEEGSNNVIAAMNNGANGIANSGLQTALKGSQESVSTAANEVSNAAVQQFLLVMSAENGSAIGKSFSGGIIAALKGSAVAGTATSVGNAAMRAASNAMSTGSGFNIGRNFGQGLANGMYAMINAVSRAAAALGNAAASALSGSIQEGSPSRLTAETGKNFGLGFINAILDSATDASVAAAEVGASAASSLSQTVSEVSGAAADQMSITGNARKSEAETLAAENEKTAQTYASAIANALNGAKVVMDGTMVGELVTGTVSEGIADRYKGMRYGTV